MLQSPNILVDASYRFKIADFGLSQTRQHTLASRGAAGGTPEWYAQVTSVAPVQIRSV